MSAIQLIILSLGVIGFLFALYFFNTDKKFAGLVSVFASTIFIVFGGFKPDAIDSLAFDFGLENLTMDIIRIGPPDTPLVNPDPPIDESNPRDKDEDKKNVETALDFLSKAQHYYDSRDFDSGATTAESGLKLYQPDEHTTYQLHLLAGLSHLALKNFGDAKKALSSAKAYNPTSSRARVGLGQLAIERHDYNNAVNYLREAVELDHRNAEAHFTLGVAYLVLGNYNEALTSTLTAANLKPDLPNIQSQLDNIELLRRANPGGGRPTLLLPGPGP